MSSKKGVLRGAKISNKHSTFNGAAREVIKNLKRVEDVKRIILGPITRTNSSGQWHCKILDEKGQIRIDARDSTSVQKLYIVGSNVGSLNEVLSNSKKLKVKEGR